MSIPAIISVRGDVLYGYHEPYCAPWRPVLSPAQETAVNAYTYSLATSLLSLPQRLPSNCLARELAGFVDCDYYCALHMVFAIVRSLTL